MKTKRISALMILCLALVAGLGAMSIGLKQQVRYEFERRELEALVYRDLMTGISPTGQSYFAGRADANRAAAQLDYDWPNTPEYILGYASALIQAAELISRAETTGSTDITALPPPPPEQTAPNL